MIEKAFVGGADKNVEWLLPWWFEKLKKNTTKNNKSKNNKKDKKMSIDIYSTCTECRAELDDNKCPYECAQL